MNIGIDIAKLKFDIAVLDSNNKYKHKTFKNSRSGFDDMLIWCESLSVQDAHFCMEATGVYYEALANYLFDAKYKVSVVNPAQIAAFAQSTLSRVKTDKADAKLIARFCQVMNPSLFTPLPANIRQLQALVRRLESLKDLQQQERNRLEVSLPVVAPSINTVLLTLAEEIRAIEQTIKAHIDDDPDLRTQSDLLKSIPGLGKVSSALLLAELPFSRHACAKSVVSFAGLNPRPYESGSSVRGKGRISKTGSARLRAGLYMPAIVAMRFNPVIRHFYQRLLQAGKPKMLAIVACMRKLLSLAFTILKSKTPFNPEFA
ncbi:IS110 family transposase [Undibacterium sp. Xuan67W]|uniref:IS110 family transposase n=1 Tax=Undibacterium sp. Xuan67W TaxID=3413057 RepID=UPI003BF42FD3